MPGGGSGRDWFAAIASQARAHHGDRHRQIEPGGVFDLANTLVGRMMLRQFEANLSNLKDFLEAETARKG